MKLDIQLFADAEVSIKFDNKVTGEGKLKKYAESLKVINSVLAGMNTATIKDIESSADAIQSIAKNTETTSNKIKLAFNFSLLTRAASAFKKLGSAFTSMAKQSFDYLENFNLFQVAFNGNYKSAERFINKMSEMYGLDESWLTQTVGKFKQLTNAMNLTAETGEKVSQLLTQMSLDISSLYNVDIDRAASTLASAMAGQTKPIRGVAGADITQPTLQVTLDQLGIDRTVNQLSFAEKRLLIIISLTRQLNASIGDMGRTIESPANQLRIMNEQWERLTRAVGNVFLPILAKILPYLNAILMVLTEIISAFATLLGYSSDDFDYFDSASASAWDLDAGLKSAGSSAKKLRQGLRSFDKLNNITTPTAAGAGGVVGGAGGVNPKLLDAFNKTFDEYQSKLKNVRMEATRIRDAIMKWLGFTKIVNSETGDVSFKLKEGYSNFKLIVGLIGTLIGFKLIAGIKGLITGTSTLGKLLGTGGLYKSIKNIITLTKDGKLITTITAKMSKFLPIAAKVVGVIGGLVAVIIGSKGVANAMKTMTKQQEKSSKEMGNYYKNVALTTAGATAAGFAIGGPLGAAIGATTGLVISATSAIIGFNKGLTELAKEDLFGKISVSTEQWTEILKNSTGGLNDLTTKYEDFTTKLNSSYDSFETSANALDFYGLKFGQLSQKISGEDSENILAAIQNIGDKSVQILDDSANFNLQVLSTFFDNASTMTDEEETAILKSVMDSNENRKEQIRDAQDNITKTYKKAIKARGYLTDEEYKYIQEQLAKIRSLTQQEMSKNQTNIEYFKKVSADKNQKLDEESYKNFKEAYDKYAKELQDSVEESYNIQYNTIKNTTKEGSDEQKKMLDDLHKWRVTEEKKNQSDLEGIQREIYTNLAVKYQELEDKTDSFSKKERKLIENIFKDINVDSKDIVSKFGTVGKKAGKEFASCVSQEINKGNIKLTIPMQRDLGMTSDRIIKMKAKIEGYAGGGMPKAGQVFVANENGPELLGEIGGKSFVANQNQMMNLLDKKMGSGATPINATFVIQVGNKEIAKQVITDLQDMAKTNGKPITIGS